MVLLALLLDYLSAPVLKRRSISFSRKITILSMDKIDDHLFLYSHLSIRHSEQRPFASLKVKDLVFGDEATINTENEILRHSDGAIKPRQTSSG